MCWRHPTCFAPPNLYGFDDPALAEDALSAFRRAMELAPNDDVRSRVEKASLCGYRLALQPCWDLQAGATIDAALRERMKPLAKQFFTLAAKYGVTFVREGYGIKDAKKRMQAVLWGDQPTDF